MYGNSLGFNYIQCADMGSDERAAAAEHKRDVCAVVILVIAGPGIGAAQ